MNIYQANIQKYRTKGETLAKVLNRLSVLRLVAFLFSIAIIVYLANERLAVLIGVVAPVFVLGYILLIKHYNQVAYDKRHADFLKEINEGEVLKCKNELSGFPTGQKFISRSHPYVSDLDVFGPHSLFQLLNRTTTESGNVCLAEWQSAPASKEVILERQEAIQELTPKLDWRQDFQATGMHFKNPKSDYNKLLAWVEKPVELLPNKSKHLVLGVLLSIIATSLGVYYCIQVFSSNYTLSIVPLVIVLLLNYLVLRRVKPIAEDIIENTHHNVKILRGYQVLVVKIESEKFHSKILQQLQSAFNQDNFSASNEINKLRKILEIFQLRGTKKTDRNKFYPVFNIFWLLDIYWILLTEKWKQRNSAYLKSWASAVGEVEVLSSLAGFSYSNPSFTFPEIKEEPFIVQFEMLGHPLIGAGKRVCNDFSLRGEGNITMVTGSNMAGKSTFLRTVGINLVLALMGAPCCARSGQVSYMRVFSSMRTQDNLEEGTSSFYAELKRIEQLLELIDSGEPVFFLLDEMFKGTNSKDRHKGGFSLIKQLKELNAFGIVSTHDLDLAVFAGKHRLVSNRSFNSEIREGEMIFDYGLADGLCRDFNASELMKKSGIKILSDIEEA